MQATPRYLTPDESRRIGIVALQSEKMQRRTQT